MVHRTRGNLIDWDRLEPLRKGPLREGAFTSPLHSERVAARLGLALAVAFGTCFLTGLVSHFMQHPAGWMHWPASPSWLYRLTQGVHVATGTASIPLLGAKLYAVGPKLFAWPPARSLLHAAERASLLLLVGGAVFELVTGLLNVARYYPWHFFFPMAHYWVAWITIGALVVHVAAKIEVIRRGLSKPLDTEDAKPGSLSRRSFVGAAVVAGGIVTLTTVGETLTPLRRVDVLGQRRGDIGPQQLPVNKSAVEADITTRALNPSYRLIVDGPQPFTLRLDQLRAMTQHTVRLPISCVEGWSVQATWSGVRVRDLLDRAGFDPSADVHVESLQTNGRYKESFLRTPISRDDRTLLGLRLNGADLDLDHGFPCRLIAPARPGVLQTKWVAKISLATGGDG